MDTKCETCGDRQWMVLRPNPTRHDTDLVAPCLGCSAHKSLPQISRERAIRLERDEAGAWCEVRIFPCTWCGDRGQVDRALIDRNCSSQKGRERVPCPKCANAATPKPRPNLRLVR